MRSSRNSLENLMIVQREREESGLPLDYRTPAFRIQPDGLMTRNQEHMRFIAPGSVVADRDISHVGDSAFGRPAILPIAESLAPPTCCHMCRWGHRFTLSHWPPLQACCSCPRQPQWGARWKAHCCMPAAPSDQSARRLRHRYLHLHAAVPWREAAKQAGHGAEDVKGNACPSPKSRRTRSVRSVVDAAFQAEPKSFG